MGIELLAMSFGAVIGFVLAMTGSGGGIMAVPLLVLGLHLSMKEAAPVGLIAVGLSASVGAMLGLREKLVRYKAASLIGLAGMLLAPLGVWTAQRVANAPLMIGFSIILTYVAWRTFRNARVNESVSAKSDLTTEKSQANDFACLVNADSGKLAWTFPCARLLAATGMISGFLSGLLGAGGGFVIVPAMSHFTALPARSIFATSLAVISLVSASGIASAAIGGSIQWSVATPFAIGAIIALLIGRVVAKRIKSAHLMQGFSLVSFAAAGLLFAKGSGLIP